MEPIMPNPVITLTPELQAYLAKKSFSAIIVDIAECKSCGGAIAEVFARGIKAQDLHSYKEKQHRSYFANDVELLLMNRIIRVDDEVTLGLSNFLGIKDIAITGLHL